MKTTQNTIRPVYVMVVVLLLTAFCFASVTTESTSGSAPPKFNGILKVVKSAPQNVSLNQPFNVSIAITNLGSTPVTVYVVESLGNVVPIDPLPSYSNPGNYYAAEPPSISWVINVTPGSTQTLSYKIKPMNVGEISIGPTEVLVSGGKFFSNSLFVDVLCTFSPTCDSTIGEGPLTCPAKCGGNASRPPLAAPQQKLIPTAPINTPPKNPEAVITEADKLQLQEYSNNQNNEYLIIAAATILIVIVIYLLFLRKKPVGKTSAVALEESDSDPADSVDEPGPPKNRKRK
ncbi:hypothetical protein HZC07_05495, partial [Candidatus Micrarchaeota archaeon]|nr:hypothetical protein [Candidatus Micrarchaeota archaeon]